MNRKAFFLILIIISVFFSCGKNLEDSVPFIMIEGIKHIQNPLEPLRGTVILEVEKKLEINPYEQEDVGLRIFSSVKDKNGDIILFDRNKSEAQRFNSTGEYQGSMIRQGEGPGEFVSGGGMLVYFIDDQIWVTGARKLAKFDKLGNFLDQLQLGDSVESFVDSTCYITKKYIRNDEGRLLQYRIRRFADDRSVVDGPVLMEGQDFGMITKKGGGSSFTDGWGTPNMRYTVDTLNKKIFFVFTPEYKITVKDVEGNTLYVIEKPNERVSISQKEKKEMLGSLVERLEWLLSEYPDNLMAVKEITMLPKGYLAVYRISGIKETEIDVFDPEGRFIYVLKMPENMELRETVFYDFGFSTIDRGGDYPIYYEYRVINLPEIFN